LLLYVCPLTIGLTHCYETKVFYQNVTPLRSGICRSNSVCLSSVTFMHRTQPVEIFCNVSMTFCSLASGHPLTTTQPRSSQGNLSVGCKMPDELPSIATLDMLKAISRKRCKMRPWVQLMTNRKSHP